MASEPGADGSDEDGARLGALLEPHIDALAQTAREREQVERERAARAEAEARLVRLDERELMALIFEHLDPDNPRVCEGIEFERLVIVSRPVSETEPAPKPELVEPRPAPSAATALGSVPIPSSSSSQAPAPLDGRAWVGRGWIDDIRPIPAAVLERPELDEQQRALLRRASRRVRASVNLRHLGRAAALRQLELSLHACRAERVRFCRVIPGKGVHSRSEPVIKRAVIDWCRTPERDAVLGWAPELDRHGEWGAMILELRAARLR